MKHLKYLAVGIGLSVVVVSVVAILIWLLASYPVAVFAALVLGFVYGVGRAYVEF